MEYRIVKKNEFKELMNLMNHSFDFKNEEQKFEHILPKYYFEENENMIHIGGFEDGKMVASIGIYPLVLKNENRYLNCAMIGGVSTHPDYRGRGIFNHLMTEVMNYCNDKYDALILSGKRERYNRFGFEYCGLNCYFNFSKNTKNPSKTRVKIDLLDENDINSIEKCLELYNRTKQTVVREKSLFVKTLKSWNNVPYILKIDNEVVGYFTVKETNFLSEFKYEISHLPEIITCLKDKFGEFVVHGGNSDLENGLDKFADSYRVEYNMMYKIQNISKVIQYLNWKEFDEKELETFNDLEKVIYICGNYTDKNRDKSTMIRIHNCDQG